MTFSIQKNTIERPPHWSPPLWSPPSTQIFLHFITTLDPNYRIKHVTLTLNQDGWLAFTFDFDIRHLGQAMCKTHYFMTNWGKTFASWTIVLVSLERFVSVVFPLKAKVKYVSTCPWNLTT